MSIDNATPTEWDVACSALATHGSQPVKAAIPKTTAELVTNIGRLQSRIQEASAKGFVTAASLELLYQLEVTFDSLMEAATAEFWAANGRAAR